MSDDIKKKWKVKVWLKKRITIRNRSNTRMYRKKIETTSVSKKV
ncbi:hypothetical protein OAO89_03165 [Pelagibacteraceae bacterium]|nr:hypothetical protein [Pelagibacteraceae bacterium]